MDGRELSWPHAFWCGLTDREAANLSRPGSPLAGNGPRIQEAGVWDKMCGVAAMIRSEEVNRVKAVISESIEEFNVVAKVEKDGGADLMVKVVFSEEDEANNFTENICNIKFQRNFMDVLVTWGMIKRQSWNRKK
jgi:hypothetical protein